MVLESTEFSKKYLDKSILVDRDRLMACRRLLGVSDSKLLDQALVVLFDALEGDRERQALAMMPYDKDTDLSWEVVEVPSLEYDGDIPKDVQRLAVARRSSPSMSSRRERSRARPSSVGRSG